MSSSPSHPPALPPDWANVLQRIQEGLDQAVAAAAERERLLEAPPPEPQAPPERRPGADGLEGRARQAEEEAARLEALLDEGAEAARRWREAAAALRARLADGAGPGVS